MHSLENGDLILVADVGGTNVRFALSSRSNPGSLSPGSVVRLDVAAFDSLAQAASEYLQRLNAHPALAVLAVAGPIKDGVVRFTNSHWVISASEAAGRLGVAGVELVNDFAAVSAALPALPSAFLQPLGPPLVPYINLRKPQVFAVVGPGTGLGVGMLIVREGRAWVVETEGGHAGFSPVTDEEVEIYRMLARRHGRVSSERLLSGPGLMSLYHATCTLSGAKPVVDTPEAVTRAALDGNNAAAQRATALFCAMLGSVAGDVVMTCGAWDGVYLAGGLVRPMLPWLSGGEFRSRFEDKGRISATLAPVPTVAVTHEYAGLIGAAAIGANRVEPMRKN